MPTRVAVDIGGTFTDLVHLDEETGDVGLAKAATTPSAFEEAVLEAVGQTDLSDVAFLAHGTTVVINALTERKGARVGLITTQGFRDVLEIAKGNRPDLYNFVFRSRGHSCLATCVSRSASGSTTRGASRSRSRSRTCATASAPFATPTSRRSRSAFCIHTQTRRTSGASQRSSRRSGPTRPCPSRTSCRASGGSTTAPRRRCSTRTSSRPSAST